MTEINKVAVIGAGVMGAGIAAHVANAGIPVVLLDIVPEGANDRSVVAKTAVAKMLKTNPAPFMHKKNARLIETGNLEDDLASLSDCDWICEAIIENPQIKRDLYAKLNDVRKPGSVVTSNTSTIPLNVLTEGLGDDFARDFAITHFFNPPRYMRLLEVVKGPHTGDAAYEALKAFGDVRLGKEVVECKDTPGFIGNRIGIFWSTVATRSAYDLGLTVEEADSIVGRPTGVPKTGIFGLGDLTGIDLGPHVIASMIDLVPSDDPLRDFVDPDHPLTKLTQKMISEGYTGRKGKGGFYRRNKSSGKTVKEAIDLKTGEYRPEQRSTLKSARAAKKGLRALVEYDDKGGEYAWTVLSHVMSYSASLVPEIADDVRSVDLAMQTGYAWKWGPFEMIDMLGADYLADRLAKEGRPVPALLEKARGRTFYKEEGDTAYQLMPNGDYAAIEVSDDAWTLADKKRGKEPVKRNASASLWDVGDGVLCLEFHSKMNSLDENSIAMIKQAAKADKLGFKAVIIGSDADNFSVGANVGVALFGANAAMWPLIENGVAEGQKAMQELKNSPFPVVAAPAGMALGGGCEVCLHSNAIQAHAESYMGLVEVGVGLLPGWGGCKELTIRNVTNKRRPGGPMPALSNAFQAISTAKVATSAAEAKEMQILRHDDGISMNRRRVLADAKKRALAMAEGYEVPEPIVVNLPGPTAQAAFRMAVEGFAQQGMATPYDVEIAEQVGRVLSGGDTDMTEEVTEKKLLELEREGFMTLIRNEKTLMRIEHMLTKGRPLRN
jgi:3-hydroxyacyl-CoA dehydrogenase